MSSAVVYILGFGWDEWSSFWATLQNLDNLTKRPGFLCSIHQAHSYLLELSKDINGATDFFVIPWPLPLNFSARAHERPVSEKSTLGQFRLLQTLRFFLTRLNDVISSNHVVFMDRIAEY